MGAGALLAVLVISTACSTGPDQPDTIAQQFAAALDAGDVSAAAALTTDPAAAGTTITALFDGLGNSDPTVTVVSVGDEDTFALDVAWNFGEGRDWTYRTSGSAVDVGGDDPWRVRWDPLVLSPELGAGVSLQYLTTASEPAEILDRTGEVLMSEQSVTLVDVDATADTVAVASTLQAVVPTFDAQSLATQIAEADTDSTVAVVLRDEDLAPVEEALASLPGVTLVPQSRLLTADRDLSSPVWSGVADRWQEGQEASAGWVVRRVAADGTGTQIAGEQGPPAPDLRTSIDLELQRRAEDVLAGFDGPAAIVGLDADTGAVLTVAQNTAADAEGPIALTGLYPPGSTFKPITVSAALQAGLVTPDTVLPCPGTATFGDRTIPNDDGFDLGSVPLHTALAFSCNTTMGGLALELEPDSLTDAAMQMGLGVDYDVPGVVTVTGSVPDAESDAARVEASIGQGQVTASPFGMALVAASVAAGRTPSPMFVQGEPGTTVTQVTPGSEEAMAELRTMMRETVTDGTASALQDVPDLVGKTGTAEYGGNEAHGWFIGSRDNLAFAVFVSGAGSSASAVDAAGRWLRG